MPTAVTVAIYRNPKLALHTIRLHHSTIALRAQTVAQRPPRPLCSARRAHRTVWHAFRGAPAREHSLILSSLVGQSLHVGRVNCAAQQIRSSKGCAAADRILATDATSAPGAFQAVGPSAASVAFHSLAVARSRGCCNSSIRCVGRLFALHQPLNMVTIYVL